MSSDLTTATAAEEPLPRDRNERLSGAALADVLTDPHAVVVVGSSADETKISGRSLRFLLRHGYRGDIHVVHPRHRSIAGIRTVPRIAELPSLDRAAAVVNLPAKVVPQAIAELDASGVGAAVVIGSGFEAPDSQARRELLDVMARPGFAMRVIGPNCVGTVSARSGAHLTFSTVLSRAPLRAGRIALVTQSGALGNGLLMSLLGRGVGLAHWFSSGDELDAGAMELTAAVLARADVDTVGLFLEGITDRAWLGAVAATIRATGKQVFVLKAARTAAGRSAAGGHTGRLVGPSEVTSAALAHAGMVEVPDLATLVDCLVVAEICGPAPSGARVGVVSVSGASAVIAADRVHESGALRLAALPPAEQGRLAGLLDPRLRPANPLDVPFLDETAVFADAAGAFRSSPAFDRTVIVATSLAHDLAALAHTLSARPGEPPAILTRLWEDDRLDAAEVTALAGAGIAVVPTVERAVAALALTGTGTPGPVAAAAGSSATAEVLGLERARQLLPELPWAAAAVVTDPGHAHAFAARTGFPVVLKAAGRTVTHRSELGAVRMVSDPAELDGAVAELGRICREHGDVLLAQAAAPGGGTEVMVSALAHPELGPCAILRPGGVLTELMSGQVVLLPDWDPADRRRALLDSPLGRRLDGFRGGPAYDVDALLAISDALCAAVSRGAVAFIELNPVFVYPAPRGAMVVDALGGAAEPTHPRDPGSRRTVP